LADPRTTDPVIFTKPAPWRAGVWSFGSRWGGGVLVRACESAGAVVKGAMTAVRTWCRMCRGRGGGERADAAVVTSWRAEARAELSAAPGLQPTYEP